MNYEGPISIKATSTGAESTLAGIGRLVAEAQAREAPVQRLADAVAGKFCYSVMAASALTFAFWSLAGIACCAFCTVLVFLCLLLFCCVFCLCFCVPCCCEVV